MTFEQAQNQADNREPPETFESGTNEAEELPCGQDECDTDGDCKSCDWNDGKPVNMPPEDSLNQER